MRYDGLQDGVCVHGIKGVMSGKTREKEQSVGNKDPREPQEGSHCARPGKGKKKKSENGENKNTLLQEAMGVSKETK